MVINSNQNIVILFNGTSRYRNILLLNLRQTTQESYDIFTYINNVIVFRGINLFRARTTKQSFILLYKTDNYYTLN